VVRDVETRQRLYTDPLPYRNVAQARAGEGLSNEKGERDMMTATYSPEDNKLRLYPSSRLDAETYQRVKAAGFIWAPKQELFVAPMWTPGREDLLIELAGEIDDEDTSLVDRAEQRAERFENYGENRAKDADRAHGAVSAIADNIPLGQPILVGHHSEKHARKDAERIRNGMNRAVKMWEQSKYWEQRAKGAIQAAKYKERPDVRARRIKGLQADKRKQERNKAEAEKYLHFWAKEGLTLEQARTIANYCHLGVSKGEHGDWSAWDVLRPDGERYAACPSMTVEQVQEKAHEAYPKQIAYADRWLKHLNNRLIYEWAMLQESGGTAADKWDIQIGGRVLVRGEWVTVLKVNKVDGKINSLSTARSYVSKVGIEEVKDYQPPSEEETANVKTAMKLPPLCNFPGEGFMELTKEEYDRKHKYQMAATRIEKATEDHGAYRYRQAMKGGYSGLSRVFVTDIKRVDPPGPDKTERPRIAAPERVEPQRVYKAPEPTIFDAMKDTLKAGITTVVAPQLFPTPPEIVQQMIYRADLHCYPVLRILEPSAGTGNIIEGLKPWMNAQTTAIERNLDLVDILRGKFPELHVIGADFLACNGNLGTFDRIVMNPPFENGSDIKHIRHALTMLKPGGRLVALCANGPRQREAFKDMADYWEDLPEGSFKAQGTGVNVALMVIDSTENKGGDVQNALTVNT
jgi:SAM-dependent methyltransferase